MTKVSNEDIIKSIKRGLIISSIAKKYNVSVSSISRRVKKLKDLGLIKEDFRSSYRQLTINELIHDLPFNERGSLSIYGSDKIALRHHKARVSFRITEDNPAFHFWREWLAKKTKCASSKDNSLQRFGNLLHFFIKFDSLISDRDYKNKAISLAVQKAKRFQELSGFRLDLNNPTLKQEIAVYSDKVSKILPKNKQIWLKNSKSVYSDKDRCLEIEGESAQEMALNLLDNLAIVDAKQEIIKNIDQNTLAINDLSNVMREFAQAMTEIQIQILRELKK